MEFTDVEFRGGIGQWRIHEFQLVGLDSSETSNIRNLRSRLNGGEKAEKAEWETLTSGIARQIDRGI